MWIFMFVFLFGIDREVCVCRGVEMLVIFNILRDGFINKLDYNVRRS